MPKDWAYENAEALSFVTAPWNSPLKVAHPPGYVYPY